MKFKLDHIFIMVSEGAPEAEQLLEFGLSEGKPNIHPGQGTSNRRFFFQNFMLELIWIRDANEARNEITSPTLLWERWKARHKKCPFGICLRSVEKPENELPFKSWEYHPAYLSKGETFSISKNTQNLNEPMVFVTPFEGRMEGAKINHKKVTSLCINTPVAEHISDALKFVSETNTVSFSLQK